MNIQPFQPGDEPQAAALFIEGFRRERAAVPILPRLMEERGRVEQKLSELFCTCPGAVAFEQGRMVGYMGWYLVDGLRNTDRRAAYVPVWGHAAAVDGKEAIYRALYREAARQWDDALCRAHAITLLAHDEAAVRTWFWNGFGLTVVDAVRPVRAPGLPDSRVGVRGINLRAARVEDAQALADLEAEHWQHYTQPPVLMTPSPPRGRADFEEFVQTGRNSVWMAFDGPVPVGYITFESSGEGAAEIVASDTTIAITGAFVRPAWRGRKITPGLLSSALAHYAGLGLERCSVNFESFNPEAAAFWVKYFTPVCYSVIRVPERA